jgi:putative transcriptional regulator
MRTRVSCERKRNGDPRQKTSIDHRFATNSSSPNIYRGFVPIVVNLDVMLARRKMRSKELAERIGITEQNVSLLKSGKVRGVRFETLERICEALKCQPGDILEYRSDAADGSEPASGADAHHARSQDL